MGWLKLGWEEDCTVFWTLHPQYRNISSGDAAFLISAGGISNTIGRDVVTNLVALAYLLYPRLVGGWLSDQRWTHPLVITLVALIAGVVPSFVIPWY